MIIPITKILLIHSCNRTITRFEIIITYKRISLRHTSFRVSHYLFSKRNNTFVDKITPKTLKVSYNIFSSTSESKFPIKMFAPTS